MTIIAQRQSLDVEIPPLSITDRYSSAEDIRLRPLCHADLERFADLVRNHVSIYYPETEPTYPYTLAFTQQQHYGLPGLMRGSRQVWAVHCGPEAVGFFVATERADGRVKVGPIVIAPGFRRRGFGQQALHVIAMHYGLRGFWKLYMTIPACNRVACWFAVRSHFSAEAILKRHYSADWDEVVFGRPIGQGASWAYPALQNLNLEASPILGRRPIIGLTNQGRNLESQIELNDYAKIPHRSFAFFNNDPAGTVLVSAPKRGGAVKLAFYGNVSTDDIELLRAAERTYRESGKRKLYTVVSGLDQSRIQVFRRERFVTEARPHDPRGHQHHLFVKIWK